MKENIIKNRRNQLMPAVLHHGKRMAGLQVPALRPPFLLPSTLPVSTGRASSPGLTRCTHAVASPSTLKTRYPNLWILVCVMVIWFMLVGCIWRRRIKCFSRQRGPTFVYGRSQFLERKNICVINLRKEYDDDDV